MGNNRDEESQRCQVPSSDVPAMPEEDTMPTPVIDGFDSGDAIRLEDKLTVTTLSNGVVDLQSPTPTIRYLSPPPGSCYTCSSDEGELTVLPSPKEGVVVESRPPTVHIPNYPREISKNDVITTLVLGGAGQSSTGEDRFYADSGANIHATGTRKLVSKLTKDKAGILVKTANNGSFLRSHGCGHLITSDYTLAEVHYVPGLDMNIVSVSKLLDLDYSLGFTRNNGCIITDDRTGNLVGKGRRAVSGLFELEFLKVPLDRAQA